MIMGRLLVPEDFGKFALASVVIGLTMTFAEFGFGPALIQRKEVTEADISFVFAITTTIGALAALVMVLLSGTISAWFDGKIEPVMLQVLSLNLILNTMGVSSRSLLIRHLDFKKMFWVMTASYLVGNMLIGISLAALGYGAWALVLGLLAGNMMANVLFLILRPVKLNFGIARREATRIFTYGAGLTGVEFLNKTAQEVDKLIVGAVSSLSLLGAFERALRIQSLPITYTGNAFDNPLFSVMSKSADQRVRLGEFFFSSVTLLSIALLYVSVITFFFASEIIRILLGEGWGDAAWVLQALAVMIFMQTFPRFADVLVRSTNEFGKASIAKATFLASTIVLTIGGGWIFGFEGAVFGVVGAHFVHSVFMTRVSMQITSFPIRSLRCRMLPVFALGAVLIAKNLIVFWVVEGFVPRLLVVLATDLFLVVLYYRFPQLVGRTNAEFLSARLGEIPPIARWTTGYSRRIDWQVHT